MLRVLPRELRLPESFPRPLSRNAMRVSLPTLFVCFAAGLVAANCSAGEQVCGTLADAFVAEELGLRREWILQVPFNTSTTRLEHVTVADDIVIAKAGDGSLHGIAADAAAASDTEPHAGQPARGTLLWSYVPQRSEGSLRPPAAGSGIVVIAGDFAVVAIDSLSGRTLWREPLPSPSVTAPVISGDWVYVPLEGGRMVRLAVNPFRETALSRVADQRGGQSPDATIPGAVVSHSQGRRTPALDLSLHGSVMLPSQPLREGVLWSTIDGRMTWLNPALPEWVRSEFTLGSPPAGRPLIVQSGDNTSIFIAANAAPAASDVVRIDLRPTGLTFVWREPLDDAVAGGAARSGDVIILPLATGGFTALAAADGKRLWSHSRQAQLLSVMSGRLWCIDDMGRLATVDPADGKRIAQYCLTPFRVPVVNTVTDRLLLASPGGIIASLAPREAAATPQPAAGAAAQDPGADNASENEKAVGETDDEDR
jgi:outer membrane protein assembly factor BamB